MDRIIKKRQQVLDALQALQFESDRRELHVGELMTEGLSCIGPNTTAVELVRMFHANNFRHLLVTDGSGRLLGLISDRDVLRCLGPGNVDKEHLSKTMASDLMSTDLITVSPRTAVSQAIGIMIDEGISCLPIVEAERLVGIVTNTDLHVLLQTLLQAVRLTSSAKVVSAAKA